MAINSQANVNRREYPLEFKASVKSLCSNESISFVHDAAVTAGLFTKPATKPVYNSLGEAMEEIGRLQRIIQDKDGTIKDKDEEIEALNIRIEMCPIVINLDAQHGDLDEEGGSFTRPKRHRRDLFSTTAELQALMDE